MVKPSLPYLVSHAPCVVVSAPRKRLASQCGGLQARDGGGVGHGGGGPGFVAAQTHGGSPDPASPHGGQAGSGGAPQGGGGGTITSMPAVVSNCSEAEAGGAEKLR